MLLERLYNRYAKKPLRLYWWQYEPPHKKNFGDEITPYLIEKLWSRRCVWASPDNCQLAGAGSIIEILQKRSKGNLIKIWGSGFIKEGPQNKHENLEFVAVRGRLSRNRVESDPDVVLGDPGLLMSIANPELTKQPKKHRIGVIPHYVDKENPFVQKSQDLGYKIIDVLDKPYDVAQQINECEIIFSSSLHGLIISESYGIPNYWIELSTNVSGEGYKFQDYASSINKRMSPVDGNALFDKKDLQSLISKYKPAENLSAIQEELVNSFPL